MQLKGGKPLRWADLDDEEDGDSLSLELLLPPKQVIGPDANGIKKIIEYKFDDNGNKVKVTTTIKVRKQVIKNNKKVIERRSIPKFGDAVDDDAGSCLTVVSNEDIFIERPTRPGTSGSKKEETKAAAVVDNSSSNFTMICRTCGKKGDHWTARCPYKDLAQPPLATDDRPTSSSSSRSKGAYVPPSLRGGVKSGGSRGHQNQENSVRVTNLSEDTREGDVRELFGAFGQITRVYVPFDQRTGSNRGFGFVEFAKREDAERAINKLNGYGYDNLILHVEWAPPQRAK